MECKYEHKCEMCKFFKGYERLNYKQCEFPFGFGFAGFMGITFLLLWPITAFNLSFYLLLLVMGVIFIISLILIIKDRKNINLHINYKYWLILIFIVLIQTFISGTRTLGEVHGFDTLNYVNMVDFNIGNSQLNSLHPHFGDSIGNDFKYHTYVFQSYYYFVSVIIYVFRMIFDVVGLRFFTLPAFVWGMQILLNFIFVSTGILVIKEMKTNKWLNIGLLILVIFFLNNLYYNNALGFIGNNFRMSFHALSTIVLLDYFKDYDKRLLWLFILINLGICAVASTGAFSIIFVLFGLFFVIYNKERNILKYYSIALYVPLLTIFVTKFYVVDWVFVVCLILCALIYFSNDIIIKLYQNKYLRIATICLPAVILILGSIIMDRGISIRMLFDNYSDTADMSFDYFMFDEVYHLLFNVLIFSAMGYYFYKNYNKPFGIICVILIITFFNPLGSTFMNHINWVYYRAYDIIINQYTICLFIVYLYNNVKFKKVYSAIVIVASTVLAYRYITSYYHSSFIPSEDYNYISKIENKELEVIYKVKQMITDYNIENPKIITSTFYMPSFIDDSSYLFGKEKRYNYGNYNQNDYELYKIFFPADNVYDNFRPTEIPDYKNAIEYLKETKYDILVVEHGLHYFVEGMQDSVSLSHMINDDGTFKQTDYSTSDYAVYYIK